MTDPGSHPNVHVVAHPLVQHKLTHLRDIETGPKQFRELVRELAMLEAYEATRDFGLEETSVTTPIQDTKSFVLAGKKVAVVPVLRAGLGMVDGVLELIPAAKVGHIGLYRDPETLQPVAYYNKLPEDIAERDVMIVDPMLATGGSAAAAVQFLRDKGAGADQAARDHRRSGGYRRSPRVLPRRRHLRVRHRRAPERPRLHRPRSRRRRRSSLRHQVGTRRCPAPAGTSTSCRSPSR